MRMLEIPELEPEKYEQLVDAILEVIPFCILNMKYSKKLKKGFFYFWDVAYIPPVLLPLAKFPPKTHENVELLQKKILAILKPLPKIKKYYAGDNEFLARKIIEFLEEGYDPLQCPKCGNTEEWRVFGSEFKVTIQSDGKVDTSGQESMTKPDDIIWLCAKCNHIVLESSW